MKVFLTVISIFIVRFFFGIFYGVVRGFDDKFIYLFGLKFYTTDLWPYFGPDVVYTQSQIPGALQALLVGVPFILLPIPEAPFIFLVILTFLSLSFFAWYLTKLDFKLPDWLIWVWVFTMPWSILWGSLVINPAYVLIFSVFFFVPLIELTRGFQSFSFKWQAKTIIKPAYCFFLMAFSFFAIVQLHLSWVLLSPILFLTFVITFFRIRPSLNITLKWLFSLVLGGLITSSVLLPTIMEYGFSFSGGVERNIIINWDNYSNFFKILFQLFYYASYEVLTYVNPLGYYYDRFLFAWEYPWSLPAFLYVTLFGNLQIAFYTFGLFRLAHWKANKWFSVRMLILFSAVLTWFSFFFNNSGVSPHKYMVFFPLSVYYSIYILEWVVSRWGKTKCLKYIYVFALVSVLITHATMAIDEYYHGENSYAFSRNRAMINQAIKAKDYKIYGKTRYDTLKEKLKTESSKDVPPGY